MPTSLKLMLFFWQVGLVDTFSLIQFCINTGSQYGAIVVASASWCEYQCIKIDAFFGY